MSKMVHILWHGKALCGQPGLPCNWPADHKWVGLPDVKSQKDAVEKTSIWCADCLKIYEKTPEGATSEKCKCGGTYVWNRSCGAFVCDNEDCASHKGLARCFCGWSSSGGDGRAELEAVGETIEEEP